MSKSRKGKLVGTQNGRFGTVWIYSDEEKRSISIKLEELQEYLTLGWKKGRKLKF